MTYYVAAYDTEAIYPWHRAPASFFIVGRLAQAAGPRLREILDHDLFDLQSHSFTHENMLAIRDDPAAVRRELVDSRRVIEDLFGREVIGFTAPGGFARGFLGEPRLLEALWQAGYRYVRTLSWQPGNLSPAPLTQPFWFSDDGFPELLEISAHAWHDNILTGQIDLLLDHARRSGLTLASCVDVYRRLAAEPQMAHPAPRFAAASA